MRNDDRGQAVLFKVIVLLAVVGVIAFDLGRPLVARLALDADAHAVAEASSQTWRTTRRDQQAARATAEEMATDLDARVVDWSIKEDSTVTLTLEKKVPAWMFGFLKGWYLISATASERASY